MTALWIAHVTVTDPDRYARYAALAGPAIAAHGGVFLSRSGRHVQLEGTDRARNVVAPELRWRADIGDRFLQGERERLRALGWLPPMPG